MKTVILIIIAWGLTSKGLGQKLVKDYKRTADKSLLKYFDTGVFVKIQCDRFTTVSLEKKRIGRHFYNENKNKKFVFSTITFAYSLFDESLNYGIYFYVSVNRNDHVISDSSILRQVPLCIRTAQTCNFISSDSAKRIAIADSIEYADDLSSQLERNKYDKKYYWIITGHQPSGRPKTNKPSLNVYAESISTSQRRIISAQIGQVISYKQFDYDW